MEDKETKLERELKELKAEVRKLRYIVICACTVGVVVAAIMLPQLALVVLLVYIVALIALLISPARRSVFPYFFNKRDES